MSVTNRWRRDLYPAEGRVNFVQLNEDWSTSEDKFILGITPVLNQMFARLLEDVRKILESKEYSKLNEIRLGYRDKLVNIIRAQVSDAFKIGKQSAYDELNIKGEVKIGTEQRDYFATKAEAIVSSIMDPIRTKTIFIVLAGVKSGKTIDNILFDIKGPAAGQAKVTSVEHTHA